MIESDEGWDSFYLIIVEEGSGSVSTEGYFRVSPQNRLNRVGIKLKFKNYPVHKDETLYCARSARAKYSIAFYRH